MNTLLMIMAVLLQVVSAFAQETDDAAAASLVRDERHMPDSEAEQLELAREWLGKPQPRAGAAQ